MASSSTAAPWRADALLGQLAHCDLRAVDHRGHARHLLPLDRVLDSDDHARALLQLVEDLVGHGAHLLLAEDFLELRRNFLQPHVVGGQQAFALENHVLSRGGNHLRDVAVGHGEGHLLDLLARAVPVNRLDQPADAGAVDVLRVALRQVGELFRMRRGLGLDLLRRLRIAARDQPGADLLAVSHFEVLRQLFAADLEHLARQAAQGERRPDDVGGVLFGFDVPFLLEQLQPLVDRQAEPLRHPLDFARPRRRG